MQPTVSIILPTYNRARFLPQAFASIRAQRFTDWELIVVDDGSTDDTRELVTQLTADMPQPVQYIHQENGGAYGARNTGLDHATGKYIAFFDSDDEWLPHHLADCAAALDANPDIDWVYGASRIVDEATRAVVTESSFWPDGRRRAFLGLRTRSVGGLLAIDDPDLLVTAFSNGLHAGLQNSVIRASVFQTERFRARRFHECEDRLFLLRSIAAGHRVGYFDAVHVVYYIHDQNSSAAGTAANLDKRVEIMKELIVGREELKSELRLSRREVDALNTRISNEAFWSIGYSLLWMNGRYREALAWYRRALRLRPLNARFWRTYLVCLARYCLSDRRARAGGGASVA